MTMTMTFLIIIFLTHHVPTWAFGTGAIASICSDNNDCSSCFCQEKPPNDPCPNKFGQSSCEAIDDGPEQGMDDYCVWSGSACAWENPRTCRQHMCGGKITQADCEAIETHGPQNDEDDACQWDPSANSGAGQCTGCIENMCSGNTDRSQDYTQCSANSLKPQPWTIPSGSDPTNNCCQSGSSGTSSGGSAKCTGYGCAGNSVLKSDPNNIDRGTNAQGNCCFDPKCSSNPDNSPTDYDCSQFGKQLRSDAQNIQRAGGSGEQTNCCEATGTTTTGKCSGNSDSNENVQCAGGLSLKLGSSGIDRGSVGQEQSNCCSSGSGSTSVSGSDTTCEGFTSCPSGQRLVPNPSSINTNGNRELECCELIAPGSDSRVENKAEKCSWSSLLTEEAEKCSSSNAECLNEQGISTKVSDLCNKFSWTDSSGSKSQNMTEEVYCQGEGAMTELECFHRCCKWNTITSQCSSLKRGLNRVDDKDKNKNNATCVEPGDEDHLGMNLLCQMPSNGGLPNIPVLRCLDESAAGCVKLHNADKGRGGLFINVSGNIYSCSAGHDSGSGNSKATNRCMDNERCSAMEGDIVTMGMALTQPLRESYVVHVNVTIGEYTNDDSLGKMHENAGTGIDNSLEGCRFENDDSSLQLHYTWENWFVPQQVTTAPLYDDNIDQGFRGMRTFGCTIKTTMTVKYVPTNEERVILTEEDNGNHVQWEAAHVFDSYNFITSTDEDKDPKSWFPDKKTTAGNYLTRNVTIWVGNDDTAGFSLMEKIAAKCTEKATISVSADATACAEVTALNNNIACLAIMTADADVAACTYTAGTTDDIRQKKLTLAVQQGALMDDFKVFALTLDTQPFGDGEVILEMLMDQESNTCPPFVITKCSMEKTVGLPLCWTKPIHHQPCQTISYPVAKYTSSSWNVPQYFQVQPVNITTNMRVVLSIFYNGDYNDQSFKKVKNQNSKLILELTKSKISKFCGNKAFLLHDACVPCPEGGNCKGDLSKFEDITTLAGWWIIPESERIDRLKPFAKCIAPGACLGGVTFQDNNTCAFNRKNGSRLCNACDIGWVRTSQGQCSECYVGEEKNHWTLILIIIGVIVMITFYSTLIFLRVKAFRNFDKDRRRKATHSTLKRILISHFHTLSLIMLTSHAWPPLLKEVTGALSSPTSFSEGTNSFECFNHGLLVEGEQVQHSVFYYNILLSTFLVPLGLVALLAFFWFALAPLCCKLRRGSLCHVEATSAPAPTPLPTLDSFSSRGGVVKFIPSDADAFISSVMMLWFLLLPSILRICFQAFECISVPTKSYLVLDLERSCGSLIHLSYSLGVAIPCIIIWVVLIPIFVLQRLNSKGHPERDTNPSLMLRWGIMHSGYRHKKFYWEVTVVFLRKLCMVLVVTFATSSRVKLHMALGILIISLHLHDAHHPFGHTKDGQGQRMLHRFETWSLLMLIMIAWNGVLFEFGVCKDVSSLVTCNILLAVGLIGNIGFLVVLLGRCLNECGKRNQVRKKISSFLSFARGSTKKKTEKDDEEQSGGGGDRELQIEMVENPARGAALKS